MSTIRIPILKIGSVLVASIQTELHDTTAVQFKDDLLDKIHETKARGIIIDLTAVDIVDSFIGRMIADIAAMAGLMGTEVVLTGLQPAVAITLVELGMELPRVKTALNLEKGLSLMEQSTRSVDTFEHTSETNQSLDDFATGRNFDVLRGNRINP
jgi:rsbT antagonist protein RsbS